MESSVKWVGIWPPEGYHKEEQLQADCAQWFHNNYHAHRRMLFHVDNNSWNNIVGAKKKALGVIPGPSDFVLILDGVVVFVEMKLPGRSQTPEQIDFMNKVLARGHSYFIVEYFSQFKNLITTLIGEP